MKREDLRRETKWLRQNMMSMDFDHAYPDGFDAPSRLTLGRRLSSAFTGVSSHMAAVVVAITCTLIVSVQINRANVAELNAQHSEQRADLLAKQEEKMRDYAGSLFIRYMGELTDATVSRRYDDAIRLLPMIALERSPGQMDQYKRGLTTNFLMDVYGLTRAQADAFVDSWSAAGVGGFNDDL